MSHRLTLYPHPAVPAMPVEALTVTLSRNPAGDLRLAYHLACAPSALRIPAPLAAPGFADGLWQHTCCEVFVAGEGETYREFNFAPSGEWAAYAFVTYRQRLAWAPPAAPRLHTVCDADGLTLSAEIPHILLPAKIHGCGLSAVIEAADGRLAYWALAHPGERPDFHRRASFTLRPEELS